MTRRVSGIALLVGRLALGGIFLYAGYVKGIQEPWPNFAASLYTWKLLPDTWLEPVARILPWIEMTLGLATISGILARWFSSILAAMLAFFLGLGVWGYATGRKPDCGCFGAGSSEGGLDAKWFSEHAAMLALGLAVSIGYWMLARRRAPVFELEPVSEELPAEPEVGGAIVAD